MKTLRYGEKNPLCTIKSITEQEQEPFSEYKRYCHEGLLWYLCTHGCTTVLVRLCVHVNFPVGSTSVILPFLSTYSFALYICVNGITIHGSEFAYNALNIPITIATYCILLCDVWRKYFMLQTRCRLSLWPDSIFYSNFCSALCSLLVTLPSSFIQGSRSRE
jgi:hypothetical protein